MNFKKTLIFLPTSMLLLSCSSNLDATSSFSSLESASSSSSTSITSSSSSEEIIDEEKPDKAGYPHIHNLDDLKKHQFHGKWIWEEKNISDTHVYFRKHFSLDSAPKKATLHISASDKATVFLNGEIAAIDAVIKRGPTPFDSYYQDIDVTSFLKKGDNVLTILVHYWGRGGNASANADQGGLLYDLDIDGKVISSDSTTKVKRYTAYRNERVLTPTGEYPTRERNTFLAEREIFFDARLKEDMHLSEYDDSSWKEASIIATPGYLPFGDLYLGDIPAFTYEEYQDCVDLDGVIGQTFDTPKTAHFQLDENCQFLPYFELDCPEGGERISFYTNTYRTQNLVSLMDDYVGQKGHNAYEQLYWRSGYILILEIPAGVKVTKVGYRKTRYDADEIGSFHSSDSRLDTLYQKAANTLRICSRDTYMDCPERERSPYSGDSANQIDEALCAHGEKGWKMIEKTYDSLSGWAKEDKTFQLRWPSLTSNECPMQNLAFVQTLPNYYLTTGDEKTVKEVYPILKDYLSLWNLNDDGSVQYRNGTFMWTDWGTGMDEDLMENGWYYWALSSMRELGESLGYDDSSFYNEKMTRIKNAFYPKFKKEGGFASKNNSYDDRANALSVLSGLVEKEDYPLVKSVLTSTLSASPYMERYVLEALAKMGEEEACLDRMLSRYGGMIDYEASTLWELWSSEPKDGTINHGWAGGPLVILSKYIAGISPTSKGYDTYLVAPSDTLKTISASVATPKGEISYTLDESKLEINGLVGGTIDLMKLGKTVASIEGKIKENADGSYALLGGSATINF